MIDLQTGRPALRVEDARFLSGTGRYIADVNLPGQLYGVVVRSLHAAAAIRSIDIQAAAAPAQSIINTLGASANRRHCNVISAVRAQLRIAARRSAIDGGI